MSPVRRGQIWWVNFSPAYGAEQQGNRPALIIQNDIGNEHSPTTIVAAIGSGQLHKTYPFLVTISGVESGLLRDSVVNLAQIRTIDKSRLIELAGNLPEEKMSEVDTALKVSLALQ